MRLGSRFAVFSSLLAPLAAQLPDAPWFAREAPALEVLYRDLHQHPELSFHEQETAARLAAELRQRGLEVTTGVGGHGLVAVLKGGNGPVVLLRADMDGLPVAEETGLPYASVVRADSAEGRPIGVMHACGHDLHMAVLVGAATFLKQHPEVVKGTVVFQLQPAEERSGGMKAMLADGLLTRFPRPDRAIALHVASDLPTGTVGVRAGFAMANVDSCDITVFGRGGHGAAPHLTIDPIVEAAQLVLELQAIVSREIDPIEPSVITVGSIQGGNKHNIIPDECHLQLTVRSYSPAVREHLLAAIRRKASAVALSCGAPEPKVEFSEPTPALRNDAAVTGLVRDALVAALGAACVCEVPPAMVAEDFGRLDGEHVPLCMFRLGTIAPERLVAMQGKGEVPALHSGRYYPDYVASLRCGVRALVAAATTAMEK